MKLCLPPKRLSASLVAFALLVACSGCTTAANSQRNAAANPNNLPTYALAVLLRAVLFGSGEFVAVLLVER